MSSPMTLLTLFSPAGVLVKSAPLTLAAKRLKSLGFDVTIDESARARFQRFAGDDDTRLAADGLYKSLTKDTEAIAKLLKENHVGGIGDSIFGVQGTADIEKWYKAYEKVQAAVNYAGNVRVHGATNPDDAKKAQKEWDTALDAMRKSAQEK